MREEYQNDIMGKVAIAIYVTGMPVTFFCTRSIARALRALVTLARDAV